MSKSATILIVDDQPLIVKVIETHLSKAGYTSLVSTTDPTSAIALATEYQPALVLLDILMPEMSGLDVLRELKSEPSLRQIPTLMVTSSASGKEVETAITLGAVGIFHKPIHGAKLVDRVRSLLEMEREAMRP